MSIKGIKVAILLSYICIASFSAAIITPALPQIQKTFFLSHGAVGWVISIFLFGYVIGQLIYGPLANRYGRLKALRIGMLINILGVILCIFSVYVNSYFSLLIGRLITALGAASGLTCTFILINELIPKEKIKQVMSYTILSFTCGLGVAVTIGGVITQYSKWQYCFWVLLFHGIALLLLINLYKEPLKKPKELNLRSICRGYLCALKSKKLIIYSLIAGFVSAFSYCYSAAAPIYAQKDLYLPVSEYGYWNLLNMLGMLIGGFVSAYLMKKYNPVKVLFMGFGFVALVLVSLDALTYVDISFNIKSVLWFFITTTFLYLFCSILFAGSSFFASNSIEDKASASSMMSFIYMLSAMISVIILGYLPFSSIVAFAGVITVFYLITFGLFLVRR